MISLFTSKTWKKTLTYQVSKSLTFFDYLQLPIAVYNQSTTIWSIVKGWFEERLPPFPVGIPAEATNRLGDLGAQARSLLNGGRDISWDGGEQGARHTHRAWARDVSWEKMVPMLVAKVLRSVKAEDLRKNKEYECGMIHQKHQNTYHILPWYPNNVCVCDMMRIYVSYCVIMFWLGFWNFSSPYGSDSFVWCSQWELELWHGESQPPKGLNSFNLSLF